jgi:hypothetical protein
MLARFEAEIQYSQGIFAAGVGYDDGVNGW